MAESKTWTIKGVLEWTRSYLADKGVENARLESEWLLSYSLGTDRVGLYVQYDKPLTEGELAAFRRLVVRRARREPLQYILGTQEFCGLDFQVEPGVLIPRHDTEVLVAEALRVAPGAKKVLDIGTGSGCICIVLARSLPEAEVIGVDPSGAALELSRQNAERLAPRVRLVAGSLFEPFSGERFDLIVSNPPYIPSGDLATLQPEVRDFEPATALDGGADGLDFYRSLAASAPEHLEAGGWLVVEIGIGQSEQVSALFAAAGLAEIFVTKDTGGIDRVVGGRIR